MPHINEKLDFCSEVFIVYHNKVLLRKHDKYGIWLSVGGHIDLGEDPVEAAYREVKEEVGLDVKIIGETHQISAGPVINGGYEYLIPPRYLRRHKVEGVIGHEHVVFVYFAISESDKISDSVLEYERGVEMRWFSKEELENEELVPNVKFCAVKALEELKDK